MHLPGRYSENPRDEGVLEFRPDFSVLRHDLPRRLSTFIGDLLDEFIPSAAAEHSVATAQPVAGPGPAWHRSHGWCGGTTCRSIAGFLKPGAPGIFQPSTLHKVHDSLGSARVEARNTTVSWQQGVLAPLLVHSELHELHAEALHHVLRGLQSSEAFVGVRCRHAWPAPRVLWMVPHLVTDDPAGYSFRKDGCPNYQGRIWPNSGKIRSYLSSPEIDQFDGMLVKVGSSWAITGPDSNKKAPSTTKLVYDFERVCALGQFGSISAKFRLILSKTGRLRQI